MARNKKIMEMTIRLYIQPNGKYTVQATCPFNKLREDPKAYAVRNIDVMDRMIDATVQAVFNNAGEPIDE